MIDSMQVMGNQPTERRSEPGPEVLETPEPTVLRAADGRLLPGSRLNPVGRTPGSKNRKTLEYNKLLQDLLEPAIALVSEAIAIPRTCPGNYFLALQAAKFVIDRKLPKDEPEVEALVQERMREQAQWMEYATNEDMATLVEIMTRAQAQIPKSVSETPQVIDVTPIEPTQEDSDE